MTDLCAIPELPPPYAEVIRVGRWLYRWQIIDGIGLTGNDGWYAYGRNRAIRKAAWSLAAHVGHARPNSGWAGWTWGTTTHLSGMGVRRPPGRRGAAVSR